MFGKILVPLDGSLMAENCLPHLISLAKADGAGVLLLHVSDRSAESSTDSWGWQIQQAEASAYLNEIAARLQKDGLQAQTEVLAGKFPDNLINRTNSQTDDLILINSHILGEGNDYGLSSVVMNLVQRMRTSVMTIRESQAPAGEQTNLDYQHILLPLDGSQRGEYGLSTALRIAQVHHAKLLLVHVVKPPDMPRRTPMNERDSCLVDQVVASNLAEAFQYLNRIKDSLGESIETRLIVSEHVADALHQLAAQENIDLIILNAHGQNGDAQWPYGSIAANFLANAAIPLLVIQDFTYGPKNQSTMKKLMQEPAGVLRPVLNHGNGRVREMGL